MHPYEVRVFFDPAGCAPVARYQVRSYRAAEEIAQNWVDQREGNTATVHTAPESMTLGFFSHNPRRYADIARAEQS